VILIVAWLAVISFGLVMCRLAARSDDAHVAEVLEWLAATHGATGHGAAGHGATDHEPALFETPGDQSPFDAQRGRYRATG
jgi:hypothetical protein